MQEKVDIIMTTYNTNIKFLREQIESIINQTYNFFSLLISDDNSTNGDVQKILKEYEKKDNRIKVYIQKKNIGYVKNFEFLLNNSTADFIMFADHDDIWYKNKVEKSLEKIIRDDVDLVYVNAKQINEKGEVIQKNYFKYKNVPLINKHGNLAISRCIGIGCSQIFTRSVKEKMIPFTEKVMAHDWLAAFIANENKGISYIEEPLFGYRLHNTNVYGGRNLAQNIKKWKDKNGNSYKSYLRYREEKVIRQAYLDGAKMCTGYVQKQSNKEFLDKIIKYYEEIIKSKFINIKFLYLFHYLGGNNLLKKMLKELIIFHFPILGYLIFIK